MPIKLSFRHFLDFQLVLKRVDWNKSNSLDVILGIVKMDMMREGGLVVRTLLHDDSNYSFWKVRMRIFLKSLDERVWWSVVNK